MRIEKAKIFRDLEVWQKATGLNLRKPSMRNLKVAGEAAGNIVQNFHFYLGCVIMSS